VGKRDYSIASNPAKVTLDTASLLGTTTFAHALPASLKPVIAAHVKTSRTPEKSLSVKKPQHSIACSSQHCDTL
jgi:hypothetical protein